MDNNFNNAPNNMNGTSGNYGAPNNNYSAPEQNNQFQPQGNVSSQYMENTSQFVGTTPQYGNTESPYSAPISQYTDPMSASNDAASPYMSTSSAYENNAYSNPYANPYENNAYSNPYANPYENNAQTNPYESSSSYNIYGTVGGTPVDEMGQPLANRFGMKMVFSILEMITIVLCNLPGFILGLIACIFNVKANNSYKAGDGEGFKSAAKVSTICLWISFATVIITAVLWGAMVALGVGVVNFLDDTVETVEKEYEYDYDYRDDDDVDVDTDDDMDDDLDEEDDEDDDTDGSYSAGTYEPVELGNYYEFTLEGVSMSLPMTVSELTQYYTLDYSFESDDIIEPRDSTFDYALLPFENADGETVGYVRVYNFGDTNISIEEGIITHISIDNDRAFGFDDGVQFELVNGISFDSSEEEVLEVLGTPGSEYHSDPDDAYQAAYYTWFPVNESDYMDQLSIDFWDGVISGISIYYSGEYGTTF